MRFIPFFAVILCFTACDKKPVPEKTFSSSIEIGNNSNMAVTSQNKKVTGAYRLPSSTGIDIDLDGKIDFLVTSIRPDSGRAMFYPPPYINITSTDSSSSLCVSARNYSTYLSHTTIQAYASINVLHHGFYTYHTYERRTFGDTLYKTYENQIVLQLLKPGQTLFNTTTFVSGALDITGKCGITSTTISSSPSLLKYNVVVDYTTPTLVSPGDEIYLGVKLTRNNHVLLGWIKLYYDYSNAIFVKETAIQS